MIIYTKDTIEVHCSDLTVGDKFICAVVPDNVCVDIFTQDVFKIQLGKHSLPVSYLLITDSLRFRYAYFVTEPSSTHIHELSYYHDDKGELLAQRLIHDGYQTIVAE